MIFLSALMLAMAACKTGSLADSRKPMTNVASLGVPLPVVTPYDSYSNARLEYLEGYREGYRNGSLRLPPSWARVGMPIDPAEPRERGWQDGGLAARISIAADAAKLQNENKNDR